jgi:hypothetical protein
VKIKCALRRALVLTAYGSSDPASSWRLAVFKPSEGVEHHTRLEEFGMTRNIDSFHIQVRSFSR